MIGQSKFANLTRIFSIVGAVILIVAVVTVAVPGAMAATLAQVVDGAKKEGTIRGQWGQMSFGGSAGFTDIVAGLNKRYGLTLKGQYTPGADMERIMLTITQEAAAGQPASTDVYLGNSQSMLEAMQANVLTPMDWRAILERKLPVEPGFDPVLPGGIGVAFAAPVVGILYNSSLVKGADIPRRLEDVLNPKWKGKIASTPYAAGLRELAMPGLLGREYIINFTKKLSKQIGGLIRCGEAERITSGEFLMHVLSCGGHDAIQLQRIGAPVAHTVVDEGTIIHSRYAGIPKNSRSPNAAALFIAYLHTPEGQALLWKHDGMDLYLYPESNMKKEVEKVRAAGGKVVVNTPQWLNSLKDYQQMQKELEKILREGGQ